MHLCLVVGAFMTLYCFSKFEASIPKASCIIEIIETYFVLYYIWNTRTKTTERNEKVKEEREEKQFCEPWLMGLCHEKTIF